MSKPTSPSSSSLPRSFIVNLFENNQSLIFINVDATQEPLELTSTNYTSWRFQFYSLSVGYDLMGPYWCDTVHVSYFEHAHRWYCRFRLVALVPSGSTHFECDSWLPDLLTIKSLIISSKTSQEAWIVGKDHGNQKSNVIRNCFLIIDSSYYDFHLFVFLVCLSSFSVWLIIKFWYLNHWF